MVIEPTAATLFVFRRRDPAGATFNAPGHPFTTGLFVLSCALIVIATVAANPFDSLIGFLILLAGVPACRYWQRRTA